MRTLAHYHKMLQDNPSATIGFTLAADMVYAAMHGMINRSEAHGGEEWRNIARRLKSKYGENLNHDDVVREMSPAKTAARALGSMTSEKKKASSAANAKLGGRPVGSGSLTPLQRQVLELRQSGLKIREIAEQLKRNPENVRQILARAARKSNIPGGWTGIAAIERHKEE